jgi:predicted GIY-YIG superfamily endonuclease
MSLFADIIIHFFYMYVYLLVCDDGSTYVGATVDLNRRLRQHNKELVGGARATGRKIDKGQIWQRHCYVSGFPDWQATLQFEWRWKQISRTFPRNMIPLERRMAALDKLLTLERSTSKAKPYSEWPSPPIVHIENEVKENEVKENEDTGNEVADKIE